MIPPPKWPAAGAESQRELEDAAKREREAANQRLTLLIGGLSVGLVALVAIVFFVAVVFVVAVVKANLLLMLLLLWSLVAAVGTAATVLAMLPATRAGGGAEAVLFEIAPNVSLAFHADAAGMSPRQSQFHVMSSHNSCASRPNPFF